MKENQISVKLLEIIDEYMKESCKKDYILSTEEYYKIKRQLEILNNHLEIVMDYETKKREQ